MVNNVSFMGKVTLPPEVKSGFLRQDAPLGETISKSVAKEVDPQVIKAYEAARSQVNIPSSTEAAVKEVNEAYAKAHGIKTYNS